LEKTQRLNETFGWPFISYSLLSTFYGVGLCGTGNFKDGFVQCQRSIHNALDVYHLSSLSVAESYYGYCLILKGDVKAGIEHCETGLKYGEEGKDPLSTANASEYLAWAFIHAGELEAARVNLEYALNFFREAGMDLGFSMCLAFLGIIFFENGDVISAENFLQKAVEQSQAYNGKWVYGYSLLWLGKTLARKNRSESNRAAKTIIEGIKVLESVNLKSLLVHGYCFLGELYADVGQREKALENLKIAKNQCLEMGIDYWPDKVREVLEKL
jgi:tetratricopeptide (TPR) repeat protein